MLLKQKVDALEDEYKRLYFIQDDLAKLIAKSPPNTKLNKQYKDAFDKYISAYMKFADFVTLIVERGLPIP